MRVTHFFVAPSLWFAASTAVAQAAAEPDRVASGLFRGYPVTYQMRNGRNVFQGDIILDHITPLPRAGRGGVTQGAGIAYGQNLWLKNSQGVAQIPYIVTVGAAQLNAAITQFNSTFAGVIQFVAHGSEPDYVNFDFFNSGSNGPCESSVGRVGMEQTVTGPTGCAFGTLLHELGHVAGLYHEMSRPDRDSFLTVNYNNVIKGSESNFAILGDNAQELSLFDYASIMMYIPYAFSRNGGPVLDTLPGGMQLSNVVGYTAADMDSVDRLYGATPMQVTVTSNPAGLAVSVDGSTITTPKTYSWALNSKHTLAVASGAQTLGSGSSATTYTYGRWNDSTAASHSIKIAPGDNTLTQPKTAPAVTVYDANFVQLSPYTQSVNAGAGSIGITPAPQPYPGVTGVFLPARAPVSLTATPTGNYQFVTWGGTSLPLSLNPKPDYMPDGGLPYSVSASFSAQPIFTITTTSPELYFMADNYYYYKGPQSFTADTFPQWAPGTSHVITGFSPTQPYSVNTQFTFNKWSDGGALSHNIVVPSKAGTLTATYTAQYVPIAYVEPDCAATLTLSPTSPNGFYDSGKVVTIKAAPAATGLVASGWTGDLSGKKTTQKLTVTDEELAIDTYNIVATPFNTASLSPALLTAGTGSTVKIKGTGFATNSAVFVNNIYHVSTFVSSKEIDVALSASDIPAAGALPIGVSNYPNGGSCGNYAALALLVANP